MMLPPCILGPYTEAHEAVKAIEVLTTESCDTKDASQRIQEQQALATLYERIGTGMDSTRPEIKRQASRKYQNKLKGSDKRTIKEYLYDSLRAIDKICEESSIRHSKAVEAHYECRLVQAISTYDEATIAREIKEALPVADEFDSVRDALDAAAVILRTMAEYRDEFSDWAPPSKDRLAEIREHKMQVRLEDAAGGDKIRIAQLTKELKQAAETQKKQQAQEEAKRKREGVKLPPIDGNPSTSTEKSKALAVRGEPAKKQKEKSILAELGEGEETIGERYEREINNLKEKIKKLTFENDAASGQIRFLYSNLTTERKAMIRTAYDFELPPEHGDDEQDEDEDEDDDGNHARNKCAVSVSEVPEKEKKPFEKRALTMLHTTLEMHQRKVKEMLKKSKKLGGTMVLYDEFGNAFIQDVKLTKRIVDPREIKTKRKKTKSTNAKSSPISPKSPKNALPPGIIQPGEYVMCDSMILHMDWDPERFGARDKGESFPEQYLRDACQLHRELAFTNPIGLAASLRYAADLCMRSRDFPAALKLYEKVVDIRKRKMGAHNPEVAQSIEYLGEIYSQMGNHQKALLLQEEALNMRLNIFGNTHVDVAQNLRSIATLQAMHGDFDEAVTLYTRALNILLKNFHKTHPQVEMVKVQLQMARQQKKEELKRIQADLDSKCRDPDNFNDDEVAADLKATTEQAKKDDGSDSD
eukprot:CAMPEP_0167826298 /NCGR_PEP_ID=MMETSP0112_2-20121227/9935_1 /TAXON_ID=91324 /ORGANISM="Lotharella globosa, Strain CCCM811" /LENGTH=698 /DNA_ID=CAMNT_0007728683 /DNA_START=238 /DNA_END=2334 /DNA_ORIENTATION=-